MIECQCGGYRLSVNHRCPECMDAASRTGSRPAVIEDNRRWRAQYLMDQVRIPIPPKPDEVGKSSLAELLTILFRRKIDESDLEQQGSCLHWLLLQHGLDVPFGSDDLVEMLARARMRASIRHSTEKPPNFQWECIVTLPAAVGGTIGVKAVTWTPESALATAVLALLTRVDASSTLAPDEEEIVLRAWVNIVIDIEYWNVADASGSPRDPDPEAQLLRSDTAWRYICIVQPLEVPSHLSSIRVPPEVIPPPSTWRRRQRPSFPPTPGPAWQSLSDDLRRLGWVPCKPGAQHEASDREFTKSVEVFGRSNAPVHPGNLSGE
jgi:hypothetical protein